jgi:death-on-curing protein
MTGWVWLDAGALLAAHDEQLAEHGGAAGVRDMDLFESALAKPKNLLAYGDPDAAELAAAYGFGLAKNHAFIDGNKRIALVAMESFLVLNGFALNADDGQVVMVILSVASGAFSQEDLANWIRKKIQPL